MAPPVDRGETAEVVGLPPSLRLLLSLAAAAVLLLSMRVAASVINPLLLALVITMAVSPLLSALVRRGLPPWIAWLITVAVTIAAAVAVIVVGLTGFARLVAEIPRYQAQLAARWQHAASALGVNADSLTKGKDAFLDPHRVVSWAVSVLDKARSVASLGLLTLLLVLFMLGEATTVSLRFAATPPRVSRTLARLEDFTRDMRRFVQATTISGLIAGTAIGVLLLLIGVPYPLVWGLFAFFMAFIPTLGPLLAAIPPTFMALLELGWSQALVVVVGILLIYAVVGNVIGRRLVARRTNLSPLAVVVSVVVWGWVLGLLGGLLAVPMTLLVRRLFIVAYDVSGWATALLGSVRTQRRPRD
jgi:predicted PurR-regulated permease PerM